MWRRRPSKVDDSERIVRDRVRSHERTMNRAVRLLAAKPRSVGELRERLLEKLWTDSEIVESVIEKLKGYGYLDDKQYALDLVRSKIRQKPQGRRKVKFTLSRKKLNEDDLESALDAAFDAETESDLARAAIEKRLRVKGTPQSREDEQKLYQHLLRQGFSYDLIREKLGEALSSRTDSGESSVSQG